MRSPQLSDYERVLSTGTSEPPERKNTYYKTLFEA